jgi:hypothetical protein
MMMMIFWVLAQCKLVGRANVWEKHTVFIFMAEDGQRIGALCILITTQPLIILEVSF